MTGEINKLFVYGTLLQGEPRNRYLEGCKLIETMDVPGKLYDTQRGYPAALFDGNPKETVIGELYMICGDVGKKLKELDEVEGTRFSLYKRKDLRYNDHHFYLYEAGETLKNHLKKETRIQSGSWRRYRSIAFNNPVRFALNFENPQRQRYTEFPPENSSGLTLLKGEIPILVTAPHATAHLRMNKLKHEEEYTGAISILLHILTGSYALYTHWASRIDPNFYDDAPFKKKLAEIVKKFGIRFVLDLHGTRTQRNHDIYPGIGSDKEFLLENDLYLYELEKSVKSNGLTLGGFHVFSASRQMTITKFVARNLRIPAMQLEINKNLRHPESNPFDFEKLINFLTRYILYIKTFM
jgi:gamma-glutamylcyclotransferase (GGCT)/AIG2-like uncharacterized protein YtfP